MDSVIARLLDARGLDVPASDMEALRDHWRRIRLLRAEIDGAQPADFEIPLTFAAEGHHGEQ
ncbi:hypothetical protein [Leekyejoonella antrihumi]|uniref:Uncharacterized protein n=1 Tax=Leekyejoonella antrihumi TaxID=1660198 RepID=A0A563DR40_9MICO|nr:hypothetical protein [Leekyejoonella antrihumi]TWP32690.1 hypothetical protein FGL98_23655 [Leekyejoonella antrihumi]